jgi:hypothetical protein
MGFFFTNNLLCRISDRDTARKPYKPEWFQAVLAHVWHIATFMTFCLPPAHSSPLHLVLLLRHYQLRLSEASNSRFILIWDFARDGVCLWLRQCAHLLIPESKRDHDRFNVLICRLDIPGSAYFWNPLPPHPDIFFFYDVITWNRCLGDLLLTCHTLLCLVLEFAFPHETRWVYTADWNFHICCWVKRMYIFYYTPCTLWGKHACIVAITVAVIFNPVRITVHKASKNSSGSGIGVDYCPVTSKCDFHLWQKYVKLRRVSVIEVAALLRCGSAVSALLGSWVWI